MRFFWGNFGYFAIFREIVALFFYEIPHVFLSFEKFIFTKNCENLSESFCQLDTLTLAKHVRDSQLPFNIYIQYIHSIYTIYIKYIQYTFNIYNIHALTEAQLSFFARGGEIEHIDPDNFETGWGVLTKYFFFNLQGRVQGGQKSGL